MTAATPIAADWELGVGAPRHSVEVDSSDRPRYVSHMHLLPAEAGFGDPPAATINVLKTLDAALDADIPARNVGNLLIGTWNLRQFGRITKRWNAAANDNPKRNLQDLCCIAETISRFDVCALVEVKNSLEALRLLLRALSRGEVGKCTSSLSERSPRGAHPHLAGMSSQSWRPFVRALAR